MLSLCNQPGSSSPGPFSCLIHRSAWRNRPKSLGRTWCVALRATENGSFRLIVTSVHCPIHSRSVTHTPFRTVSEGEFCEVHVERRPGPRCLVHFGAAARFAP